MQHTLFDRNKPSAEFSPCGRFRWVLRWPTGLQDRRILAVCGANPSVAGQRKPDGSMRSDPTVSRMRNLARELGFGWIWMVNARSFVSTDPNGVPPDPEAIGEHTDNHIEFAARSCDLFLCAWGNLGGERGARVIEIVRAAGKVPHALGLTADGSPRHPRGIPKEARPFPMEGV